MNSIKKLIESDLYRYTGKKKTIKNFLRTFFLVPGFRYSYFLRKASRYSSNDIRRLFYWIIMRRIGMKFGFQISSDVNFMIYFYSSPLLYFSTLHPCRVEK